MLAPNSPLRAAVTAMAAPLAPAAPPANPAPPTIAPARGPPLWEMRGAGPGAIDPQPQPAPDYAFDQRIAWQGQQDDTPQVLVRDRS